MTNNKPFTSTFLTCHALARSFVQLLGRHSNMVSACSIYFACLTWLVGWLVDCLACTKTCHVYCLLVMYGLFKSNQNRNDCKSTQRYIVGVAHVSLFDYYAVVVVVVVFFFSPVFHCLFGFLLVFRFVFVVVCRVATTQYGKKQNMVEHINKTTTSTTVTAKKQW